MAVHVLTVLAYKEGDRVPSSKLAASVNTNPVIIRRLLLDLQAARLIETTKGAGAGSRLNRAPGRINLAEVYEAVEARIPFARPTRKPNENCPVGQCMQKVLGNIFESAETALKADLRKTTLASLMAAIHEICGCDDKR